MYPAVLFRPSYKAANIIIVNNKKYVIENNKSL